MNRVEKTVLVMHSAEKMFGLVDKVEDYPNFLPWCGGVVLHECTENITEATINIDFHGVKQHFHTRNLKQFNGFDMPKTMQMKLVDGPFKTFEGGWQFIPLQANACKIIFNLNYAFANPVLEKLIAPVFSMITTTFVDHFVRQADRVE